MRAFVDQLTQTITIHRQTMTEDGDGSVTIATTETVVTQARIWQASAARAFMAERRGTLSSHVLVLVPGAYTWDVARDRLVTEGDHTYEMVGRPDDVMDRGEIEVLNLQEID